MSGIALLVVFTAAVGWLLPPRLAEAAWTARAPKTALALWCSLLISGGMCAAMAAHRVLEPGEHHGIGLVTWLMHPKQENVEGLAGHTVPFLLVAAVYTVGGLLVVTGWVRDARARAQHRALLDLVARPSSDGPWWVVDDDRAAAWCVPGRGGRIVVTRRAVQDLTEHQRNAVVAHERAHLAARHHLPVAACRALGQVLPRLPLTRVAAERVPLLAEMAADDAAVLVTSPRVLAQALCTVAVGAAPGGALNAGAVDTVTRVRRLASFPRPLGRPLRAACWVLIALLPLVPPLVACGP